MINIFIIFIDNFEGFFKLKTVILNDKIHNKRFMKLKSNKRKMCMHVRYFKLHLNLKRNKKAFNCVPILKSNLIFSF